MICSVSFLSICAMIASIDLTTSLPMSFVCDSACSASVRTARSTASLASSVFGLNSFLSSESNSVTATTSVPASAAGSVILHQPWLFSTRSQGLGGLTLTGFLGGRQRLQEGGILQQFADQIFCAALAIHVGDQVRQLLPRLE